MSAAAAASATAPIGMTAAMAAAVLIDVSARATPTVTGAFAAEAAPLGLWVLGVVAITARDRLVVCAAAPTRPTRPRHRCDAALLDRDACTQRNAFQHKDL